MDDHKKAKIAEIEAMRETMQEMCDEIIADDETENDTESDADIGLTKGGNVKVATAKKNGAVHGEPTLPKANNSKYVYKQGFLPKYT